MCGDESSDFCDTGIVSGGHSRSHSYALADHHQEAHYSIY
jgi:hypothetical protein